MTKVSLSFLTKIFMFSNILNFDYISNLLEIDIKVHIENLNMVLDQQQTTRILKNIFLYKNNNIKKVFDKWFAYITLRIIFDNSQFDKVFTFMFLIY